MYAVIRLAKRAVEPALSDEELVHRIDTELVPMFNRIPGFIAYYVVDTGERTLTTVSVFETRAGVEESTRTVRDWIERNREAVGSIALDVAQGEVRVHKTAEAGIAAR